MRRWRLAVATVGVALIATACDVPGIGDAGDSIEIDGSRTVHPINETMTKLYEEENGGADISVGRSSTRTGLRRFCKGEIDIAGASRQINPDEMNACRTEKVAYLEFKVALDGVTVVANKEAAFAECITTGDLKKIWKRESKIKTWRDVRPEWPAEPIELFGPVAGSGTIDYFVEQIVGETGRVRSDYEQTEDADALARRVAAETYALGLVAYPDYRANADELKAIGVDSGAGCVVPSTNTIRDEEYTPLTRPLYLYVSAASFDRDPVEKFTRFYVYNLGPAVKETGSVQLPRFELDYNKEIVIEAAGHKGRRSSGRESGESGSRKGEEKREEREKAARTNTPEP